jgi:hypothetical protein
MQDLDSAVGRLDNILMSVYVIVAILIIAVALVRPPTIPFSQSVYGILGGSIGDIGHWRWYFNPRCV